jgi:hypothetical protein
LESFNPFVRGFVCLFSRERRRDVSEIRNPKENPTMMVDDGGRQIERATSAIRKAAATVLKLTATS